MNLLTLFSLITFQYSEQSYVCLDVNMDEQLNWEKRIDMICSKVSAGIGTIRRIRPSAYCTTWDTKTYL